MGAAPNVPPPPMNATVQLLELLPDEPELLARAATTWLKQAKQPHRALPLARRLARAAPAASAAHELLGDCCM